MSDPLTLQIKTLNVILNMRENSTCADCNSRTPRWASISRGVFVCLRCSGIHREMTIQVSKIKSTNLDKWKPEWIDLFKHINNDLANSFLEAKLPKHF
jgi:stromal membrane-associated protein